MNTPAFFMSRALELATQGLYTTTPNPRVGCVIVDDNGNIVGEGWHERAGEPHAEVHALRMAGDAARGATAYVTLEPCSHFGRTPPCAQALINAGIKRVIAAMEDPNPEVSGRGLTQLQEAGIETLSGMMEKEARALNEGFISRMTRQRPWLRIKLASSLDGKVALNNGQSQWITGEAARADGHHWRARSCAILTGIGTVLADNPRLNVRAVSTPRQPLKIVVDALLSTPLDATVLENGNALIVTASKDAQRIEGFRQRQVDVLQLPDSHGHVDLQALMMELGKRGINEVLTEAGPRLNGALIEAGCADALLLYQAPILLGDKAQSMLALPELTSLNQRGQLSIDEVSQIGDDLRILARFHA